MARRHRDLAVESLRSCDRDDRLEVIGLVCRLCGCMDSDCDHDTIPANPVPQTYRCRCPETEGVT